MDPRYRFLTLGIPWTQSMPSRDVNAATRLAEASWTRDKKKQRVIFKKKSISIYVLLQLNRKFRGHLELRTRVVAQITKL